ncbi:hypothetical protein V8B97DRAFT_1917273 [Scleroderma yunnanense]
MYPTIWKCSYNPDHAVKLTPTGGQLTSSSPVLILLSTEEPLMGSYLEDNPLPIPRQRGPANKLRLLKPPSNPAKYHPHQATQGSATQDALLAAKSCDKLSNDGYPMIDKAILGPHILSLSHLANLYITFPRANKLMSPDERPHSKPAATQTTNGYYIKDPVHQHSKQGVESCPPPPKAPGATCGLIPRGQFEPAKGATQFVQQHKVPPQEKNSYIKKATQFEQFEQFDP